jgi:hypothetical protein
MILDKYELDELREEAFDHYLENYDFGEGVKLESTSGTFAGEQEWSTKVILEDANGKSDAHFDVIFIEGTNEIEKATATDGATGRIVGTPFYKESMK